MNLYTHSEPGGNVVNEDYLLARRHPESDSVLICALADGQGGCSHGAEAAKAACDAVWAKASSLPPDHLFQDNTWLQIMAAADLAAATTGGFTTLVAFAIERDFAAGASAGDSKVYFRLPAKPEIYEWTIHQRKNPPVGSESVDAVPFMCHAIGGGRLLVASDGVWKYCGFDALKDSFALPADQVSSYLRTSVTSRAGSTLPDDFSLIVIDID